MLNKIFLQGRLVADPELRHTQSGIPVASFRIAVDRDYKNQNGEKETDFINIVAWRGTGEFRSFIPLPCRITARRTSEPAAIPTPPGTGWPANCWEPF